MGLIQTKIISNLNFIKLIHIFIKLVD